MAWVRGFSVKTSLSVNKYVKIIILIIIIIIIIKSLFNTHKKELCTVLHLKGIKTKFVP